MRPNDLSLNDFDSNGLSRLNRVGTSALSGVSALVCLLAAILVIRLKLYTMLVYRLSLYQVLSSLVMASVSAMQVLITYEYDGTSKSGYACIIMGLLQVYTEWIKLLFTMWVAFHLFCFAVLHKNLKKLEVLYIVTSLILPALIAIVPLVTHSYGLNSDGAFCYIYANTSTAFIERLALWDGPAMLILIAASIAMIVMVLKLTRQVCRRSEYEPITDSNQFWKALKQLLPLAAFPMLFFIFEIPVFVYHVYTTQRSTPQEEIYIAHMVCFSLWSMTSGATVMVHNYVVRIFGRKSKPKRVVHLYASGTVM